MRRLLFLFVACAVEAVAQFAGLATTGDGSALYFSSPLRLSGAISPFTRKIFRRDTELTEYLSRDPGPSIGYTTANFYDLISAQPSSDGSLIGISAARACNGGSGCLTVQTTQATISDSSGHTIFMDSGYADLSPNGRWAIFYARNTFGIPIPVTELVDLTANQLTSVPYSFAARPRRQVANDGTVAAASSGVLHLWNSTGDRVLAGATPAPSTYSFEPQVLLSADARRVVYQTPYGLALYDVAGAAQTSLAGPVTFAAISDDASAIAFINAADSQIWLANPLRRLTNESDGMAEVSLSGDGRTAYAATTGGRLLRIDVASANVTELVPRTPWITSAPNPLVPGSLYLFAGSNLAPAQLQIAGIAAPVQSSAPDQIWFQVPWEVPVQDAASIRFLSGSSPFESPPGSLAVQSLAPGDFTIDFTLIAIHQDFRGLVTAADPAVAGEVVVLYLNGLGPVAPAVATGALSPAAPTAQITLSLTCQIWDGGPNDAQIFFAGLAPGMVGVYQVNVQLPAGLRINPVGVSFTFGPDQSFAAGLLPVKL